MPHRLRRYPSPPSHLQCLASDPIQLKLRPHAPRFWFVAAGISVTVVLRALCPVCPCLNGPGTQRTWESALHHTSRILLGDELTPGSTGHASSPSQPALVQLRPTDNSHAPGPTLSTTYPAFMSGCTALNTRCTRRSRPARHPSLLLVYLSCCDDDGPAPAVPHIALCPVRQCATWHSRQQ